MIKNWFEFRNWIDKSDAEYYIVDHEYFGNTLYSALVIYLSVGGLEYLIHVEYEELVAFYSNSTAFNIELLSTRDIVSELSLDTILVAFIHKLEPNLE